MIFFQFFLENPTIGTMEGTKAFTECYWIDNHNTGLFWSNKDILRSCFATFFPQFHKSPGKYTSETCQVETKPVCKKKIYEDISQVWKLMWLPVKVWWSKTWSVSQTLEKDNIVSVLIYLCFSEADLGPLPHIWWISS